MSSSGSGDAHDEDDVDVVVLAGYMKKLGPETLVRFRGRGLNTHPALLPKFGGSGSADERVGRVRHLYALSAFRRRGVGRCLIAAVIEAARGRFGALRLRTGNPEAARVYEAIGFQPSGRSADCTHIMELAFHPDG